MNSNRIKKIAIGLAITLSVITLAIVNWVWSGSAFNFLVGLSATLNVITLAIVIWVWSGGAYSLINRFFVRPIHERSVSQFEVLGVQSGDTVFLGDSLTEGGKWHELFPQSNVRNRGIGGDTTSGVIARLDQITDGQPAQVFLMIGTNEVSSVSQADIVANIIRIIDKVHDTSPQTDVFVQSILPRGEKHQKRIESLNSALETAIDGKATWVDLYPLFLDEAGISIDVSLSNDQLHLLGQGYLVWRDAIAHLINNRSEHPIDRTYQLAKIVS